MVDLAGHLLTSLNVYCTIQMTKEHKKTDNPGETDQCVYVTVRTGYNDKELVKALTESEFTAGYIEATTGVIDNAINLFAHDTREIDSGSARRICLPRGNNQRARAGPP